MLIKSVCRKTSKISRKANARKPRVILPGCREGAVGGRWCKWSR